MRQTWHGRVGQSSAVCMGEAAVGGCTGMAQPHGYGHSCMGSPEGHFVFTWKRLCRNINSSPLLPLTKNCFLRAYNIRGICVALKYTGDLLRLKLNCKFFFPYSAWLLEQTLSALGHIPLDCFHHFPRLWFLCFRFP